MRLRGSRYDGVKTFAPGDGPGAPFPGLRARDIGPATGLLEHVIGAGERLDLLALQFYNDDRLWWRILDANPGLALEPGLSLASLEGRVLIIPRARE